MPSSNECSAVPVNPATFPKFDMIAQWKGNALSEFYHLGFIKLDSVTGKESDPIYVR